MKDYVLEELYERFRDGHLCIVEAMVSHRIKRSEREAREIYKSLREGFSHLDCITSEDVTPSHTSHDLFLQQWSEGVVVRFERPDEICFDDPEDPWYFGVQEIITVKWKDEIYGVYSDHPYEYGEFRFADLNLIDVKKYIPRDLNQLELSL